MAEFERRLKQNLSGGGVKDVNGTKQIIQLLHELRLEHLKKYPCAKPSPRKGARGNQTATKSPDQNKGQVSRGSGQSGSSGDGGEGSRSNPANFDPWALGKLDFNYFLPCPMYDGEDDKRDRREQSKRNAACRGDGAGMSILHGGRWVSKRVPGFRALSQFQQDPAAPKYIQSDYEGDLDMDNLLFKGQKFSSAIREGFCAPLVEFLQDKSEVTDPESNPMELGEDWGAFKKAASSAFKTVKKVVTNVKNKVVKSWNMAKTLYKEAMELKRLFKAIQKECLKAVEKTKCMAKLWLHYAIKRKLKMLWEQKCNRNSNSYRDRCAKKGLASRRHKNMRDILTLAGWCGPFMGALFSPSYFTVMYPMTRWDWDPAKYAVHCDKKKHPECKDAAKHYHEFPLYFSNYTKWNVRNELHISKGVFDLGVTMGCPNFGWILETPLYDAEDLVLPHNEFMKKNRAKVLSGSNADCSKLLPKSGIFTKDTRWKKHKCCPSLNCPQWSELKVAKVRHEGYTYRIPTQATYAPGVLPKSVIEKINKIQDSARHQGNTGVTVERVGERLRKGFQEDGVIVGVGSSYKVLMEYRDFVTLEIKCAAIFEATASGCTTCNCEGGRVLAKFNNRMIYVASSKVNTPLMDPEDDKANEKVCVDWFTQIVSVFQGFVSLQRTTFSANLFSNYGYCV